MDQPAQENWYCDYVAMPTTKEVHRIYHDTEYGFPSRDESVLFERLVLEINQAGLSWETILMKREGFKRAYDGFVVDKVAAYGPIDVERLLSDAGIIRNRLKIAAAIANAQAIREMRASHGGFAEWIDSRGTLEKPEWVKEFRTQFKFVGGEIVGEFLMSLGILPGAHSETCATLARIRALSP
jgi:DNA-3-methyladenine glycosylase I